MTSPGDNFHFVWLVPLCPIYFLKGPLDSNEWKTWFTKKYKNKINTFTFLVLQVQNITCTQTEYLKKSIKRDSSLFKTLSDGKFWDNWWSNTLETDQAQDVEVILYQTCAPVTADDINLFTEKTEIHAFCVFYLPHDWHGKETFPRAWRRLRFSRSL